MFWREEQQPHLESRFHFHLHNDDGNGGSHTDVLGPLFGFGWGCKKRMKSHLEVN